MPRETRVFLSYRRSDSAGYAGRLWDGLSQRLGPGRVFRDWETIRPGEDYVDAIAKEMAGASVVLVVIGLGWMAAAADGRPRLLAEDDIVRREIRAALAGERRVIPVLVGGAALPDPRELPEDLRPLLLRNAFELRDAAWAEDLGRLCAEISGVSQATPATGRLPPWGVLAGAGLLAATYAADVLSAHGLTMRGGLLLLGTSAALFAIGLTDARRTGRGTLAAWIGLALCLLSPLVLF